MRKRRYQNFWGKPKLGKHNKIAAYVEIGKGVRIGSHNKIEAFSFIPPGVEIGDNCFIGPHVVFTNHKHPEWRNKRFIPERTIVEDDVTIGAGSVILPGVRLHRGCTVGAGSMVTTDIPEDALVYGNPARQIPFK